MFRATYARARGRRRRLGRARPCGGNEGRSGDGAAARVKYDALRWYASKLAPKVYGDKLQHANAAGDGDQTTRIIYGWEPPADPEAPA